MNGPPIHPRGAASALTVASHALTRYHEHHPGLTAADVRAAVRKGIAIDRALAATLLGRKPPRPESTSTYVIARDHLGMFVLDGGVVRTYLRFGHSQRKFCAANYPTTKSKPQPVRLTAQPVSPRGTPFALPTNEKQAVRYLLGHLALGEWTAMVIQYGAAVTAQQQTAIRKAILSDTAQSIGKRLVRIPIGVEQVFIARAVSGSTVRIQPVAVPAGNLKPGGR